jgi:hypothetical protein
LLKKLLADGRKFEIPFGVGDAISEISKLAHLKEWAFSCLEKVPNGRKKSLRFSHHQV